MKTISYTVQVSSHVYADFTVEVVELAGPDYDFDVQDIQLVHVTDDGTETALDMSTLSHNEQEVVMTNVNDAIDQFLSDNADRLLAKHADPNFLERLNGNTGWMH